MGKICRRDLEVIFIFAVHVGKVDDHYSVYEKKLVRCLADIIHLSAEIQKEFMEDRISLTQYLNELSSSEAKALLIKTMCAIACADGEIHPAEIEFINRVNTRLGNLVQLLPQEVWNSYEKEVLHILETSTQPLTCSPNNVPA